MSETTIYADPKGALDAAIEAARLADPVITTDDARQRALVPAGFTLQDITDPDRLPSFVRQSLILDDKDSLVAYCNRFKDARSVIFADLDAGTIRAAIDWHAAPDDLDVAQPSAVRHSATLKLRNSEEFARWNEWEGAMHDQADFAAFIEENVADVMDPEQGTLIEICRDLEASQGTAFRSGIRLENGDRTFHFETETRVKGEVQVPTEITLGIPLYHGEEPVEVRARFRFKVSAAGLMLGFRWHRVEYQRQATFRAMAFAAAEDTGLPVYFGR